MLDSKYKNICIIFDLKCDKCKKYTHVMLSQILNNIPIGIGCSNCGCDILLSLNYKKLKRGFFIKTKIKFTTKKLIKKLNTFLEKKIEKDFEKFNIFSKSK